jgi:hypothetical protein
MFLKLLDRKFLYFTMIIIRLRRRVIYSNHPIPSIAIIYYINPSRFSVKGEKFWNGFCVQFVSHDSIAMDIQSANALRTCRQLHSRHTTMVLVASVIMSVLRH